MLILRDRDHRRMPWKNGRGETAEIAIFPEGASVANFDWRISTAKVTQSGLFSVFPQTIRTLAVLEGAMVLSVAGQPDVTLTPAAAAIAFAGDAEASAVVLGPVLDLNVMVRRGAFRAEVRRIGQQAATGAQAETFVLAREPAHLVTGERLGCGDVLRLSGPEVAEFRVLPADAWLIEILPA